MGTLPDAFRYRGEPGMHFIKYRDKVKWLAAGVPDDHAWVGSEQS